MHQDGTAGDYLSYGGVSYIRGYLRMYVHMHTYATTSGECFNSCTFQRMRLDDNFDRHKRVQMYICMLVCTVYT